jgi:hypothetical protein
LASESLVSALATDKARYERDSALYSVAKALAKVGLLSEALAAMREIGSGYTRAGALISVVDILVKSGFEDKAREVGLEGLTVVQKELNNNPHYLSSVVEALAKLGMTAEAYGMAAEVFTAARSEKSLNLKAVALPLA